MNTQILNINIFEGAAVILYLAEGHDSYLIEFSVRIKSS